MTDRRRAVADLGVVVVFAAGNSGHDGAEMSISPYSVAPPMRLP